MHGLIYEIPNSTVQSSHCIRNNELQPQQIKFNLILFTQHYRIATFTTKNNLNRYIYTLNAQREGIFLIFITYIEI